MEIFIYTLITLHIMETIITILIIAHCAAGAFFVVKLYQS